MPELTPFSSYDDRDCAVFADPDLHLKRPCLLVGDLARSLQLYRDVLGFDVDYVSPCDRDSYLYEVFQIPAEATLTFAALNSPLEIRAIALVEVRGIDLAKPAGPLPHRDALVMQVGCVATAIAAIEALGLKTCAPRQFSSIPGRLFNEQGFYDFDGRPVVLYAIAPG